MNIIYFDHIEGSGINAQVGAEWDFYRSFDDLVKECSYLYGDNFILASVIVVSGEFISYSESLNHGA